MYSGSNPLETSIYSTSNILIIIFKKNIFLFCILFILSDNINAQKTEESDTIKIFSWNIQMLPDLYSPIVKYVRKKQKLRLPEIIKYLDSAKFDIVILQEVFDLQAIHKLNKNLKSSYPFIQKPIKKGRGVHISNGIMILSKYNIKYIDNIPFSKVDGIEKMAKKSCVIVSVEINNKNLLVAGTHLNSTSQKERNKQYHKIKDYIIDEYKSDSNAFILAGDFNTDYRSKAFSSMLTLFDMKCSGFKNDTIPPITFSSSNYWNKSRSDNYNVWIDFILHDLNNYYEFVNQKINKPYMMYKEKKMDLADHYGIELQIIAK
jgi:endonuclease/exonuclease/phosphatase family metal-dependent hydrolase